MNVNSATGLSGLQGLSAKAQTASVERGADGDGDNDGGGSRVRGGHGGGRQLLNAVAQTLSQLGLGQAGQIAVNGPTATQDASGNNDPNSSASNNGQNIGQALHAFMHSLFQALNQSGSGNQAASNTSVSDKDGDSDGSRSRRLGAAGAAGYTDLVSKLQSLAQNLSSGSNSSGATSNLGASFKNLVQALGSNTSANSNNSQLGLQSFLQGLVKNLQSKGGNALSGVGSLVSTSA